MRPNRSNKQSYRREKEYEYECKDTWNCRYLLNNTCQDNHHPEDKANAKSLKSILKRHPKELMVVTLVKKERGGKESAICLFDPLLPIMVVEEAKLTLEPGIFYSFSFVKVQNRQAVVRYDCSIGPFDSYNAVQKILNQFCLPQYFLGQRVNRPLRGHIKVVDSARKLLITGTRPIQLQKMNEFQTYPVLHCSQVQYNLQGNKPNLTRIKHPRDIKLSGILQIDKNSLFYFKPRNTNYDDMNPYFIPQDIQKLIELSHIFPYCMFREEGIEKSKRNAINEVLGKTIVKGQFRGWNLNYRYPVIELEEEIAEMNVKNIKSSIIYESGIQISSFSHQEKKEAEKIAKKFSIKDYSKRPLIKALTIDSRHTRCRDDAVSIKKLTNGSFQVSIHIADVADLIKANSQLNDEIKKRDKTIYIKNYHQPMVPEALKKLLSLGEGKQKITYSLEFEVNQKGLIDFRTVRFFKSTIEVEQNMTHEQLSGKTNLFPEFFQLDKILAKSNLIDSNYILECDSISQSAMTRLIFISSIIPTFILQENIKRSLALKQQLDSYIKRVIDSLSQSMEKWQEEITKINGAKKEEDKIRRAIGEIDRSISKDVEKERQKITREIKEEMRKVKKQNKQIGGVQKPKRDKQIGRRIGSLRPQLDSSYDSLSESQSQITENISIDNASAGQLQQDIISIKAVNDEEQQKQKAKRIKNIKQAKQQQSSSESESSYDSEQDSQSDIGQGQQAQMRNAQGGKKYLQRMFNFFNIKIEWRSIGEINDTFNQILKKNRSRLYQEYFKRMQIMNRQHFKYILRMQKSNRKGQNDDRDRNRDENGRRDRRREERTDYHRGQRQEKSDRHDLLSHVRQRDNKEFREPGKNKGQQKRNEANKREKIQEVKEDKLPYVNDEKKYLKKQPKFVQKQDEQEDEFIIPNKKLIEKKVQTSTVKRQERQIQFQSDQQSVKVAYKQQQPLIKESSKIEQTTQVTQLNRTDKVECKPSPKPSQNNKTRKQQRRQKYQAKNQNQYSRRGHKKIGKESVKVVKQQKKQQQPQIKLNEEQQRVKIQIKNKIYANEEYYYKKYHKKDLKKGEFQVSEDQLIAQQQNHDIKDIYIKSKKASIRLNDRTYGKKIDNDEKQSKGDEQVSKKGIQSKRSSNIPRQQCKKPFKLSKSVPQLSRQYKDFKLTQQQEDKKCLIKERIKSKQQQYYNKYRQAFLNQQVFDISDDQFIDSVENNTAKILLKRYKANSIFVVCRTVFKNGGKIQDITEEQLGKESDGEQIEEHLEVKKQNTAKDTFQRRIKRQQKIEGQGEVISSQKASSMIVKMGDQIIPSTLGKQGRPPINLTPPGFALPLNHNFPPGFDMPPNPNMPFLGVSPIPLGQNNPFTPMMPPTMTSHQKPLSSFENKKVSRPFQQRSQPCKDQMNILLKQYLISDVKTEQVDNQYITSKKLSTKQQPKKLTKKQIKAKIQTLLISFTKELKAKYSEQKKGLNDKLKEAQNISTEAGKELRQELTKVSFDYNLIDFISESEKKKEPEQKKQKKKNKNKKEKKEVKKKKKGVYQDFLQNFELYAKKSNFKFDLMNQDEINCFLEKKFEVEQFCKPQQLQQINQRASLIGQDQESLLKWNNPIRSYQSLQVLRMLKYYSWLFQSELNPLDILLFHHDIKQIQHDLKDLQNYREDKLAKGDSNKKAKEANREISKLQFYNLVKKDPTVTHTFLSISSKLNADYKMVFHPVLQEIRINNSRKPFSIGELFKEVQGRVSIKKEFPLQFMVELI